MIQPKIQLIIFDAYGVILNGGYPDTMKFLAKKFHRNWRDLYDIFYKQYFNLAAMKKITQKKAWERALYDARIPMSVRDLKKWHYGFMDINEDIHKFIMKIKKQYKILLLSKNTRSQFYEINKKIPLIKKIFGKNIINTWEYNLPKASKKTMNFVFKQYKVKPREVVYIDDQKANLEEPTKMGVHTIFYTNFKQFKNE